MAFEWLTGSLPFDADTPQAVLFKQALEPLPDGPLRALPAAVGSVLRQVLDKTPAHRHATAGELVDALAVALSVRSAAMLEPDPAPIPSPRRRMTAVGLKRGNRVPLHRVRASTSVWSPPSWCPGCFC
jgi:hypothetical protein